MKRKGNRKVKTCKSIVRTFVISPSSSQRLLCKNTHMISEFHCAPEIPNTETTFWVSLFRLNAQTYLLTLWRSRDQPSLGPAVARTPPLLNSPSGRLSSRLNVVDWLLFNLKKKNYIHFLHNLSESELLYSCVSLNQSWRSSCNYFTYFPNSFFIPLDFFLPSGVVGSVWVLSLLVDLCGIPAKSRWSVPCRSVSAKQTDAHRKSSTSWAAVWQTCSGLVEGARKKDRHMTSPRQTGRSWWFVLKAVSSLLCMHQTLLISD